MKISMKYSELMNRLATIRLSRIKGATALDAGYQNWYILGDRPPHFPVPTMIGIVQRRYSRLTHLCDDNGDIVHGIELIVSDCDESADPRLCISAWSDGIIIDDYPHDSPNYR